MMHSVVRNHLEAHLEGSLLPAPRRELEAHLRECSACRTEIEEATLTREWMRVLVTDAPTPAAGFYARVRARVEAERSQLWPFWQLMPAFGHQFGYALATTVLLLSSYFFTMRLTENQSTVAEITRETPMIRAETPNLTTDVHANRERVMVALMAPGRVEGD